MNDASQHPSLRRLLLQVGLASGAGAALITAVVFLLVGAATEKRVPPPLPAAPPLPVRYAPTVPRVPVPPMPPATPPRCEAPRSDAGSLHRIVVDDQIRFPGDTRIDFEHAADGTPLHPGDHLERAYVDLGVSLATSIDTSYVGVNSYVVDGRSHGNSAATVSPVWEGELTLRFHAPGNPALPATVNRFGLWIAHVFPNGTALQAYDVNHRLVGVIQTRCLGSDFLAFRSDVPIAWVRVVPNRSIDPNYTIDDLVFDAPTVASARLVY